MVKEFKQSKNLLNEFTIHGKAPTKRHGGFDRWVRKFEFTCY